MSETKLLTEYDRLRTSLDELKSRFEKAADFFPALFHQEIFAPKDPLVFESWNGFVAKNEDHTGRIWEHWEINLSGISCERWYGEKKWYDVFTFLGESGYLILKAIDSLDSDHKPKDCFTHLPELSDHDAWLEVVYRTSHIAAPLLRLQGDYWRAPDDADGDEKERLLYDSWSKCESSDDLFPNHPSYLFLKQNLFAASVEAIRIWLDDNEVPSVESVMDDTPIVLPPFDEGISDENDGVQDPPEPPKFKPSFQDRTLMLGDVMIKKYIQPATDSDQYPGNQERVLMTFEDIGWPFRIDDPIPPSSKGSSSDQNRSIDDPMPPLPKDDGIDQNRRRIETARSITKTMKVKLIKFRQNGEGFSWDYIN